MRSYVYLQTYMQSRDSWQKLRTEDVLLDYFKQIVSFYSQREHATFYINSCKLWLLCQIPCLILGLPDEPGSLGLLLKDQRLLPPSPRCCCWGARWDSHGCLPFYYFYRSFKSKSFLNEMCRLLSPSRLPASSSMTKHLAVSIRTTIGCHS